MQCFKEMGYEFPMGYEVEVRVKVQQEDLLSLPRERQMAPAAAEGVRAGAVPALATTIPAARTTAAAEGAGRGAAAARGTVWVAVA